MGSRVFFIATISFASLGCVFLMAAMGSTSWMVACVDIASAVASMTGLSLSKSLGNLTGTSNSGGLTNALGLSKLGGAPGALTMPNINEGGGGGGLGDIPNLNDLANNFGAESNPSNFPDMKDLLNNLGGGPNTENVPNKSEFGDGSDPINIPNANEILPNNFGSNPMNFPNMDTDAMNVPAGSLPSGIGDITGMLGTDICMSEGLFMLSMSAGSMTSSVAMKGSSIPISSIVAAVAMIISILCTISAVIALVVAARGHAKTYEGKASVANRTRAGVILLIIAGLAGITGMACYTGGSRETLNNPATMTKHLTDTMVQAMPFGGDRGASDVSGMGGVTGIFGKMFGSMDVKYGYSFFLGWVAVFFLIVSIVLAIATKQILLSKPYHGTNEVNL